MFNEVTEGKKIVVVAGSSSGIGKACCQVFQKAGWHVVALARTFPEIEYQDSMTKVRCDLLIRSDIEQAIKQALPYGRQVDAVVHSIGDIYETSSIESISWERWKMTLDICLGTAVHLVQETIGQMCATGGAYTFISSVAARHAYPGISDYCATKAALESFACCLATEMASKGIRSNAIAPAAVDTPLLRRAPFSIEEAASWHKLGRVGTPQEIALMAHYLSCDAASWMTGQTITMDGGMLL